ncbi:hypothetical protein ACFOYW_18040 [Gryllotalpicola reticulitermitis]|uniref:Uncharacterized protein n=1 Tax=Gryllotalpicola reticulitermitis TaxID=1184153 RepID=A0ABV8QAI1_9MICO
MSHAMPQRRGEESAPSTERLAIGINLAADVILAVCLLFFLFDARRYPMLPLDIAAWALLLAVVTLTQLGAARRVRLPTSWWTIARIVFGAVIVLDVFGVLDQVGNGVSGPYPTAAIGVGSGIAMFATAHQRERSITLAIAALGILLAVDIVVTAPGALDPDLAPGIVSLALALAPPIVGVATVRAFRNMVEFQSDLSQAKGTTSAAATSLGQTASEQLVRLDMQAEQLLDDVASGRTPLPLSESLADSASTIATQLRMNLVARKSETWLHHALTESTVFGAISTIDDPDGLAASLAPDQRDGLLTGIWMLAGDGERVAQALTVTVRRNNVGAQQRLAVTLELIGVPKRRVDPAAWQAISRVGRYTDVYSTPTLRVDVDCALDLVADR